MAHITIDGPSQDHHELDVQSTDVVDQILNRHSENLDNPEESRYYEPAFIIGEDIPFYKGKTFAECGIEHGDTLYYLLGLKKRISIHYEPAFEDITIPMTISRCDTVGNVIETLCSDPEKYTMKMAPAALDLRIGDEILDKTKTLAEYTTKNGKVNIHLICTRCIQVSIGVPTYTKLKQVLFNPWDTVEDIKDEVKKMLPHFEWTAGIGDSYPVPLRGVVYICEKGTIACIYLNVFRDNMEMFVGEYNSGNEPIDLIGCHVSGESTLDDVHRIIITDGTHDEWIEICGPIRWPRPITFDWAWMRTFAPHIQVRPLSAGTSMVLFFFPLCVESVQSDYVSPHISVAELTDLFCKKNLRLEGVLRSIFHPPLGGFFSPQISLHEYYRFFVSAGGSPSVLLAKPYQRYYNLKNGEGTVGSITVWVQWQDKVFPFEMKSSNTINTLRDKIEDVIQVPFYMLKLMFNWKPLEGNCTFEAAGITHRSVLILLASLDFEMLKYSPQ